MADEENGEKNGSMEKIRLARAVRNPFGRRFVGETEDLPEEHGDSGRGEQAEGHQKLND